MLIVIQYFNLICITLLSGENMPFKKKCASSKLHAEWNISESLELVGKVKSKIRDELLERSGIDPKHVSCDINV